MPSIAALAAYFLLAMNAFYPQKNHTPYEAPEVTLARYEAFARDTAFAVSQPYVKPLFEGKGGRAKTGLVFLAIGDYESRYKASVLRCEEAGDHGHSWGPFQAQIKKPRVCSGTLGALEVAIEMTRESFDVCRSFRKIEDRLAEYTDGNNFRSERAAKRSELRMLTAIRYWAKHPYTEESAATVVAAR
jgi:hypothetical protein